MPLRDGDAVKRDRERRALLRGLSPAQAARAPGGEARRLPRTLRAPRRSGCKAPRTPLGWRALPRAQTQRPQDTLFPRSFRFLTTRH